MPAEAGTGPSTAGTDVVLEGRGTGAAVMRAYTEASGMCRDYMGQTLEASHRNSDIELEIVQNCLILAQN